MNVGVSPEPGHRSGAWADGRADRGANQFSDKLDMYTCWYIYMYI